MDVASWMYRYLPKSLSTFRLRMYNYGILLCATHDEYTPGHSSNISEAMLHIYHRTPCQNNWLITHSILPIKWDFHKATIPAAGPSKLPTVALTKGHFHKAPNDTCSRTLKTTKSGLTKGNFHKAMIPAAGISKLLTVALTKGHDLNQLF